ncbi:MAG TPA: hypothetical protein VKT81_03330 [Bryobacteraceae bacterium]|nr:hypothetical protein [Bryobacteraceae bacterium]
MKLLGIVGGILVGGLMLSAAAFFLFFRYVSQGELRSSPPGGNVTIAFIDNEEVRLVMAEICQESEVAPHFEQNTYRELLASGTLALVPDKNPVLLEQRGNRGNGFTLSRFKFERGVWRGRVGWTCPNSAFWNQAYP